MMPTITSMGMRTTPMSIAMMTGIMTMSISVAIKGKPHFWVQKKPRRLSPGQKIGRFSWLPFDIDPLFDTPITFLSSGQISNLVNSYPLV
jgi:hypothetical protein